MSSSALHPIQHHELLANNRIEMADRNRQQGKRLVCSGIDLDLTGPPVAADEAIVKTATPSIASVVGETEPCLTPGALFRWVALREACSEQHPAHPVSSLRQDSARSSLSPCPVRSTRLPITFVLVGRMATALLPFGSTVVPTLTLPCRAANSLLFNRRTPPVSLLTLLGTRGDRAVFGFGALSVMRYQVKAVMLVGRAFV